MDHARSIDPAVQAQLDRLTALGPGSDTLGLDRITRLVARLGDPHRALPPTFHVAGTNGKGSTCAFLRAALEADGCQVHVYTSPHLVRFNERIRLAGRLIDDVTLASLLEEVLDLGGDIGASFFEVTTAAAFLAFARTAADACVIEVGLGGRLDATNILLDPAACGIAQLGIDHQAFLGNTLVEIAREKAGIAKPNRPLLCIDHPPPLACAVREVAAAARAELLSAPHDWQVETSEGGVRYRDAQGVLVLPMPRLPGAHQATNLALAAAMLRHQDRIAVSSRAIAAASRDARWPARMQRLTSGPLLARLPAGSQLWLDGGHNPAAAHAIATVLRDVAGGHQVHLILGMLSNKDAAGLLAPFVPLAASLTAVPIPHHAHHPPEWLAQTGTRLGIAATAIATDVPTALAHIRDQSRTAPRVLILGSLYLAGEVLVANDEYPD